MKRLVMFIVILLSAGNVFAYDWSSAGFTKSGVQDAENPSIVFFSDKDGRVIGIENPDAVSEKRASNILTLNELFYSWQNIKVKELRFSSEGEELKIVVYPSSFSYKNEDLLQYVVGGMLFTFDSEVTQYNFRVKKGNLFLRIKGVYIEEKLLCDRISEALANPALYIQRRDPEYLLYKLDNLERGMETLMAENERLKRMVIGLHNTGIIFDDGPVAEKELVRIVELRKKFPDLKRDDFIDKVRSENIDVSKKEISLILSVFFSEFKK